MASNLRDWSNWITAEEFANTYGLTKRRAQQILVARNLKGDCKKQFLVSIGLDGNMHGKPIYKLKK